MEEPKVVVKSEYANFILTMMLVVVVFISWNLPSHSISSSLPDSPRGRLDQWQVSAMPDGFLTFDTSSGRVERYAFVDGPAGQSAARLIFDKALPDIQGDPQNVRIRERMYPELKEARLKREADEKAEKEKSDAQKEKDAAEAKAYEAAGQRVDTKELQAAGLKSEQSYDTAMWIIGHYRGTLGELIADIRNDQTPFEVSIYTQAKVLLYSAQARSAIADSFGGVLQAAGASGAQDIEVLSKPPYAGFNPAVVHDVIAGSKYIHDKNSASQQRKALKLLWEKAANKTPDSEGWHILTETGILPRQAIVELRSIVSPAAQAALDKTLSR